MTQPDNTEDTVEVAAATTRGRVVAAALLLVCVLLVAGFQLFALPFMNSMLGSPLTSDSIYRIKSGFTGLAALVILPALFMMFTGWRIIRRGQFPLPDAWVWRDTRIKRGAPAKRIGRLCIAAGVLACLVCVAMLAYAWIAFDRLLPAHELRPGIVIVKESYATRP
jgi:formate hydrogenlyase subunit 3/multisubunit Na+/H+ antiporter MnhD subunit